MGKENFNGKMEVIMKEILLMVNSLVLVLISLLILIKHIQVNLEIVIWKEKGKKCGQMEEDMKEILKMVKKMEKGCLNGPMGQGILGLGEMGSNMDQECGLIHKMEVRDKVNGFMGGDKDGYQDQK